MKSFFSTNKLKTILLSSTSAFLLNSYLNNKGNILLFKNTQPNTLSCLTRDTNQNEIPEYFDKTDQALYHNKYPNLTILNSRAVEMLFGIIRDQDIGTKQFRFYSNRILRILVEETLGNECNEIIIKQSPLGYYKTINNSRNQTDYAAVSIMRSGDAMVEEILNIMPDISVGKVLVQRDETKEDKRPIFYYAKLPVDIHKKRVFLLDPMLGTGGSACAVIDLLLNRGVTEDNIIFINLLASPPGLDNLFSRYPKIKIVTGLVDQVLLPNKYIAPGMGDFGDRFYGTEH